MTKQDTEIKMTKPAFVKEHRELLSTLKSGDKSKLKKEYKEQSTELKKYLNSKLYSKK